MASGHVSRIKRPNTWLHRPMLQNVKKALANSEPSTHGTKRTSSDVRLESAFRGTADYMCSERVFRLLTQLGHETPVPQAVAAGCERQLDFCCWTPLRHADRL